MIHSCSELPAYNTPSGKACVDAIAQKFVFTRVLGQGKQGVAFEVVRKQQKMVVKVVELGVDGINEVETQCLLNDLKDKTGVFTHIFGWQVCDEMPAPWAEWVNLRIKKGERFLFIFMEKSIEQWEDVNLKPSEEKAILFLMLHGLMVARRELNGFSHDDIHKENVMLQPIELNKTLSLDDGYVVGPNLRFVPKFIDYGFSLVGYEEEEEEASDDDLFGGAPEASTDMASVEFLFMGKFPEFFDTIQFATARQSDMKDYESLQTLLDMDFFREFHGGNKENHMGARCSVCSSSVARYQWQGKNSDYTFCSKACGNLWGQGIGEFVK